MHTLKQRPQRKLVLADRAQLDVAGLGRDDGVAPFAPDQRRSAEARARPQDEARAIRRGRARANRRQFSRPEHRQACRQRLEVVHEQSLLAAERIAQ